MYINLIVHVKSVAYKVHVKSNWALHTYRCKICIAHYRWHMMMSSNINFPRYWSFVRGIHRSPVNSPHKDQWRGALMFSLISAWINGLVNNHVVGDFRSHCAHYDVTVMVLWYTNRIYHIIQSDPNNSPIYTSNCPTTAFLVFHHYIDWVVYRQWCYQW